MRNAQTRWIIVALLTLSVGVEAGAFLQRAEACRYMRMAVSERPRCCDLGGMDRFTREGGDCCKHLLIGETEPAGTVAFDHLIADARLALTLGYAVEPPRRSALDTEGSSAYERPPPLPPPTETVVLRI